MFRLTQAITIASCVLATGAIQALDVHTSPKTHILYIRHGEVPGNNPSPSTYTYTGSGTDESLTEKGRAQAANCAEVILKLQLRGIIEKVTAIYSSTLNRAKQTALPIANELGLPIEQRYNLREIDWGCADGQLVEKMDAEWDPLENQVAQEYPLQKERWDHLPVFTGAETFNSLLIRTLDELETIAENHQGETVIVVGHGRVLKTLIANDLGSEENLPYPSNCGIAEFTYSQDEGIRFVKILQEL